MIVTRRKYEYNTVLWRYRAHIWWVPQLTLMRCGHCAMMHAVDANPHATIQGFHTIN